MGPQPVISDVAGLRNEKKKRFIVASGVGIRPIYMSILIRPFFLIGEGKCSPLGLISTDAFFLLAYASKSYATVEINPLLQFADIS